MSVRKMKFLPNLQEFLKSHGEIYTVRRYLYSTKDTVVENIGPCTRILIGTVTTKSSLKPYLAKSGFESIDSWWDKITQFVPYQIDKKYLWHVCIVEDKENHTILK